MVHVLPSTSSMNPSLQAHLKVLPKGMHMSPHNWSLNCSQMFMLSSAETANSVKVFFLVDFFSNLCHRRHHHPLPNYCRCKKALHLATAAWSASCRRAPSTRRGCPGSNSCTPCSTASQTGSRGWSSSSSWMP